MSVVSAPTKKFHEHIILCKDKHNCLGDLLFVHGYCVDYRYMVADTKLAKHFNYYAINLPAHGDNVENTFINLTLETFADYVISYIEYRKSKGNFKKLILMGHSMGGGIVSIVASKRPDLITHLILICPYNAATLLVGLPGFYIFQPKNMKQKYRLLSYLYKNYNIYMDDPQWVKMNEDQLDWQIKNWNNMKKLYKHISSISTLLFVRKCQKSISGKYLLITGAYDGVVPSKWTMHNFSRYSNKSTIYEFANSGHLPFEEETERFVSLVKEYIASESR